MTLPDGREALGIKKGFSIFGGGPVAVTGPDGRPVGTMERKLTSPIRFTDPGATRWASSPRWRRSATARSPSATASGSGATRSGRARRSAARPAC
ncbi:hypothetical protein ACFQV2_35610 [Actinokineospora soli]|uniref:Uncharacterized protein n=1 Tax=Actinokineospora soli TaxID=1048753 RepID=A0ABW2TZR3_9PSEU